ncbi:hypothetical protein EMCRGX_G014989 [Ephydatia muelleri]
MPGREGLGTHCQNPQRKLSYGGQGKRAEVPIRMGQWLLHNCNGPDVWGAVGFGTPEFCGDNIEAKRSRLVLFSIFYFSYATLKYPSCYFASVQAFAIALYNTKINSADIVTFESVTSSPPQQHHSSGQIEDNSFQTLLINSTACTRARLRAVSASTANACALDPDCHHALTCRSGGDIIARHNKLRDCFANLCSKACLSPQLEKGPGIDFSRPADVLVPNWSLSNPAAFDLKVIHPLNTDLILEASLASGNSAEFGEIGKHTKNDQMCGRLGWTCIPLVVEVYGGWGCEAQECFSRLTKINEQNKSIVVGPFYIGTYFEPIWTLLPEDVAVVNPTGYRTSKRRYPACDSDAVYMYIDTTKECLTVDFTVAIKDKSSHCSKWYIEPADGNFIIYDHERKHALHHSDNEVVLSRISFDDEKKPHLWKIDKDSNILDGKNQKLSLVGMKMILLEHSQDCIKPFECIPVEYITAGKHSIALVCTWKAQDSSNNRQLWYKGKPRGDGRFAIYDHDRKMYLEKNDVDDQLTLSPISDDKEPSRLWTIAEDGSLKIDDNCNCYGVLQEQSGSSFIIVSGVGAYLQHGVGGINDFPAAMTPQSLTP